MFKLNSKIDNVRDYVIYKGKPYYINTSHELQCGEKKQMLYKTPLSPLATFNGKFYCSEWENYYKIFDENLELIEEGKDKIIIAEFFYRERSTSMTEDSVTTSIVETVNAMNEKMEENGYTIISLDTTTQGEESRAISFIAIFSKK